jgi:hypothetical protein
VPTSVSPKTPLPPVNSVAYRPFFLFLSKAPLASDGASTSVGKTASSGDAATTAGVGSGAGNDGAGNDGADGVENILFTALNTPPILIS